MSEKQTTAPLPMEHLRFLGRCAAFELACAELYVYFDRLFLEDPEFSALWRKTAREEENHAQQFDLAVRLKGIGMLSVKTDLSTAFERLQKLEEYVESLMESNPSKEQALDLAIRLEDQLAEMHMASIVDFHDEELKRLFTAMLNNDRGHVVMLRDFLSKMQKEK